MKITVYGFVTYQIYPYRPALSRDAVMDLPYILEGVAITDVGEVLQVVRASDEAGIKKALGMNGKRGKKFYEPQLRASKNDEISIEYVESKDRDNYPIISKFLEAQTW